MKFLEARNQHRDTGIPLWMYMRAPLFRIHRAYIIYGYIKGGGKCGADFSEYSIGFSKINVFCEL